MTPGDLRVRLLGAAALMFTAAALGAPSAAHAKTFKVGIDDIAGDGKSSDSRDMVGARVAYNRKSGAISMTVRMNADYELESRRTLISASISNLVNGRCQRAVLDIAAGTDDPATPVAATVAANGKLGKYRYGSGNIDGDVFNIRVRHRSLSGRTVGCVYVAIYDGESAPLTLLDDTDQSIRLR